LNYSDCCTFVTISQGQPPRLWIEHRQVGPLAQCVRANRCRISLPAKPNALTAARVPARLKRIELAGRTNFASFDPLANQNALSPIAATGPERHIQANAQYLHTFIRLADHSASLSASTTRGNTADYLADEVQAMAREIASEHLANRFSF
jgi:hypothetical protein